MSGAGWDEEERLVVVVVMCVYMCGGRGGLEGESAQIRRCVLDGTKNRKDVLIGGLLQNCGTQEKLTLAIDLASGFCA